MKIGIVTDSTSDIPVEWVEKYSIQVVPAILSVEGESFTDGQGMSRETFYNELPNMTISPTTAAPSVNDFQKRYENLLKTGVDTILSIHVAQKLSGIYNAARLAAEPYGDRIHIIDSQQLSLGLGFQVLSAAAAAANGAALDTILLTIQQVRSRLRVIALLDTLEYLRRSGRVSWARATLGGLLNLKPMVELKDSTVHNLGAVRTARQGQNNLLKMLQEMQPLERLAILHSNAEPRALELLNALKPNPLNTPLIVNVTTVIGTHVGPNGLGFAAIKQ